MIFWLRRKNGFIRKMRLISRFTTSQPGQRIIATLQFQIMKFGQLMEYSMIKLNKCSDQEVKVSYSLLLLYVKLRAIEVYWSCKPLVLLRLKFFFFFKKKRSGISLPSSFCAWFLKEIFLFLLHSVNWPTFIVWLSLLCEILGNMYIVIVC